MATYTADQAAATYPVFKAIGAGILCRAYGVLELSAEPSAASTAAMCKLPAGAIILGGFLRMNIIDAHADTETLDVNVGVAGNDDKFLNGGVMNGNAVTNYLPEGGSLIPLQGELMDGPVTLTAETEILVTFVDDPATFITGTGVVTLCVDYICP